MLLVVVSIAQTSVCVGYDVLGHAATTVDDVAGGGGCQSIVFQPQFGVSEVVVGQTGVDIITRGVLEVRFEVLGCIGILIIKQICFA